jgi:hypothetical protein
MEQPLRNGYGPLPLQRMNNIRKQYGESKSILKLFYSANDKTALSLERNRTKNVQFFLQGKENGKTAPDLNQGA